MAAASDKARFFLEQSVPELKEFERKHIFTSDEIQSIARKRSDFEHKINARGSIALDYVRYAEFEINVDALKRKRIKRLGIKGTTHNGQRRVFFVFDRGTKKHPGDIGLWMQSIEFARQYKAHKKLTQIFTTVLRLHPTRPELWIYAAQFAMEDQGDITLARSYMQRGLRFNKNKKSIWVEYTRLEMAYIAKIHARRQILGIVSDDAGPSDVEVAEGNENERHVEAEDLIPQQDNEDVDEVSLEKLKSTPVMSGKIPIAVFDAAMTQFNHDADIAISFFEMVADFDYLVVANKICHHVANDLQNQHANKWQTWACYVQLPLLGVLVTSPEYPAALREALSRLRRGLLQSQQSKEFKASIQPRLSKILTSEDLDVALRMVINATLKTIEA